MADVPVVSRGVRRNKYAQLLDTTLSTNCPTVIPVFAMPKRISLVTQCALYLTLAGYLVFFIVILSMHQQVQPSSFLLAPTQGNSGWGKGAAWLLAINNSMYAYGSTDAGQFVPHL